jgi:hypothetical protein
VAQEVKDGVTALHWHWQLVAQGDLQEWVLEPVVDLSEVLQTA